jgi:hypothetical protein
MNKRKVELTDLLLKKGAFVSNNKAYLTKGEFVAIAGLDFPGESWMIFVGKEVLDDYKVAKQLSRECDKVIGREMKKRFPSASKETISLPFGKDK